mgnify:CR=1 FL=1
MEKYGLIGYPLRHSFSIGYFNEKFKSEGINAEYVNFEIPQINDFMEVIEENPNLRGLNVTIPYKKDVIPYLDELDENAKAIGAVNTIVNKNGKLYGHNTDFSGFMYMLKKHNIKIEGKKCVVLGDGGASKAVVAVLKKMGAKEVIIVDIIKTDSAITYDECFAKHTDAEFIANTSPVGMFPKCDASPVDLTKFPKCEAVADVIYNPLETKLVAQAKELGMTGVNGLEMLVAQALYAVEFFLEKKLDEAEIDKVYKKIYTDKLAEQEK